MKFKQDFARGRGETLDPLLWTCYPVLKPSAGVILLGARFSIGLMAPLGGKTLN